MKKILYIFVLLCPIEVQAQWTQQTTGFQTPNAATNYIHIVNENTIWVTAADDLNPSNYTTEFAISSNGGSSFFCSSPSGYSGYGSSMIFGLDSLTAWMPIYSSNGGAILKTSDGGISWIHQSSATFNGQDGFPNFIHFWNDNEGICGGDPNNGYFEIYTTSNGGDQWTRLPHSQSPIPINENEYGLIGAFCVIGDLIWFTTSQRRLRFSYNKGQNWLSIQTPNNVGFTGSVIFKDTNHGLLLEPSNNPKLFESFDGGITWAEIDFYGTLPGKFITYIPGSGNTWVCSGGTKAVFSTDGGHIWHPIEIPVGTQCRNVQFSNTSLGWFGNRVSSPGSGGIIKFQGSLQNYSNDVGLYSIDILPVLEPGEIIPKATFINVGSATQTFDVECKIFGGSTYTKQILNLQPSQTIQIEFDTIVLNNNCNIKFEAILINDQNISDNDDIISLRITDHIKAYGYIAYDPSYYFSLGPCILYPEYPVEIVPISIQSNQNFLASGTWGPDDKWYCGVFYDYSYDTGGELVTVDPQTGERTTIGFMGYDITGISYDFTTSTMYAVDFYSLYSVNIQTGHLTFIGSTNAFLINLACDSQGNLYGLDIDTDVIGSVNKTTGNFTPLFGVGFDAYFAQDMEFDRYTDECYMTGFNAQTQKGYCYKIDILNNFIDLIGQFSGGAEITGFAIPYDPNISVSEYEAQITFELYPNPTNEYIYIITKGYVQDYKIYDTKGSIVFQGKIKSSVQKVEISSLQPGNYIFEIKTYKSSFTKKVTKLQ